MPLGIKDKKKSIIKGNAKRNVGKLFLFLFIHPELSEFIKSLKSSYGSPSAPHHSINNQFDYNKVSLENSQKAPNKM